MKNEKVVVSGGSNILGLLGVLFVALKLTGVITWSWWWVTAPFWGGFAFIFGFCAMMLVVAGAIFLFYKLLGIGS